MISIKAKKLEINKINLFSETKKRKQSTTKNFKNVRNMHTFCLFNETHTSELVPDYLINVTKKYHCRDKYLQVCIKLTFLLLFFFLK